MVKMDFKTSVSWQNVFIFSTCSTVNWPTK